MESVIRRDKSGTKYISVEVKARVIALELLRVRLPQPFLLEDYLQIRIEKTESENRQQIMRLIKSNWLKLDEDNKEGIVFTNKSLKYIQDYRSFVNENGPLMKKRVKRIRNEKTKYNYETDLFLGEF